MKDRILNLITPVIVAVVVIIAAVVIFPIYMVMVTPFYLMRNAE